jgi:hypothetical protein
MRLRCAVFIVVFFNSVSLASYAQPKTLIDSIAAQIELAGTQQPAALLFVHFDKTIYSNNENVWFTGYLLKDNVNGRHHTLSVALIREDDRSVLAEGKYVLYNGLAFGNMVLPDSLPTGNYSLVCYTNVLVNGLPPALFIQPLTIKSSDASSFNATLSLMDSITTGKDSARVLLKAMTKDYTLVKKAKVKYFIGDRAHPLHSGILKTDNFGEAQIPVPLKEITTSNNMLQAEIDNGTAIKNFSIKLPVYKKQTLIKFYPEGGHLIEGAVNTVGCEALNNEGEPLSVTASLYQNDQLLQMVKTNLYGMGSFTLSPEKGANYYVKLPGIDTSYPLPFALPRGPVISVTNALAADTLFVTVNNGDAGNTLLLLVHDYQNVFINSDVNTTSNMMRLKIPLPAVPKGLATLTILDSMGRPLAERIFFAHFDKRALVTVSTDSSSYAMRQKVTMHLKLADADHHPLTGLVSIACVQNNRLDLVKTMNIENYAYLTSALQTFFYKGSLMRNDAENTIFLEQLLLIKGWRKYTWQDIAAKRSAADAVIDSLQFKGKITINKKALKRPVLLNLKNFVTPKFSELQLINTDSTGKFELLPEKIVGEPDRKFEITVRSDRQEEYAVAVNDPYAAMNKNLAASLLFPDYSPRSFAQSSQAFVLKKGEVVKTLKTVVVKATKDDRTYLVQPGTNACGDYVCMNGILNCTNHPNDRYQPVVGRTYGTRYGAGSAVTPMRYDGCLALTNSEYKFSMQGIYKQKEFYVTDLTKADISDAQYLSTLYWNYSALTNANGELELSFYTSDIAGKFRIVVQGITKDLVLYGEQFFEVRGE